MALLLISAQSKLNSLSTVLASIHTDSSPHFSVSQASPAQSSIALAIMPFLLLEAAISIFLVIPSSIISTSILTMTFNASSCVLGMVGSFLSTALRLCHSVCREEDSNDKNNELRQVPRTHNPMTKSPVDRVSSVSHYLQVCALLE